MSKIKEIRTTKKLVEEVLYENRMSRNSDMVLYIKVCEKIDAGAMNKPFWYVLSNLKDFNYPNFETVRRTRQHLQRIHPELAADEDVEAQRIVNEQTFRNFARGHC